MTTMTLAAPDAAHLAKLIKTAGDYAQADRAVNTRRAYGADLRHFQGWAAMAGVPGLPATAGALVLYLTDHAHNTTVATLAHRLAAIRAAHQDEGWPAPDSPALRRVWAGIRRTHGKPARGKDALLLDDLMRVLSAIPDTTGGKRDRALLLVGFAAALRRSELAALELEGGAGPVTLAFVPQGLEIRIARAKGDQEGRGAVVAIPWGRDPVTCAATAVRAWIDAAAIKTGPVFRRVTRAGKVGAKSITPQVVALVVKAAAARVGLDSATLAGHSLRAGLISSAAIKDAPPDVLSRHARHARFETTMGYIRAGQRFTRNAAAIAGL